jgi:hypothetical protein
MPNPVPRYGAKVEVSPAMHGRGLRRSLRQVVVDNRLHESAPRLDVVGAALRDVSRAGRPPPRASPDVSP